MKKLISLLMICCGVLSSTAIGKFQNGVDILKEHGFRELRKRSVGLMTMAGAKDSQGVSTLEVFLKNKDSNLKAVFFAEHDGGFSNLEELKKESVFSNIPFYNTHTLEHQGPKPEWLEGINTVVVDLQGLGMRYYTFRASMVHMMAVCFRQGVELIILDRPNPLGGYIGGPCFEKRYDSFLGMIEGEPLFPGMTMGEVANFIKKRGEDLTITPLPHVLPECGQPLCLKKSEIKKGKLTIIKMKGYNRNSLLGNNDRRIQDQTIIELSPSIQKTHDVYEYAISSMAFILAHNSVGFYDFPSPENEIRRFRYISSPKISAREMLEFVKRYPRATQGMNLSIAKVNGSECLQCDVVDFAKTEPGYLSLVLVKLAQLKTSADEWKNLSDTKKAMIRAHAGDSELSENLISGRAIDIDYFQKKWNRLSSQFKRRTRGYYLY